MSAETTRETMQAYIQALLSFGDYARYLTEDVTVAFMGTDRIVAGREAARQLINFIHTQAFKTDVKMRALVCGDGQAMVEAEFAGTHIGAFEGIPASYRQVLVPYAVAYELEGHHIKALRLYFPLDVLLRQISGVGENVSQAVQA
jgi:hypothetical protein